MPAWAIIIAIIGVWLVVTGRLMGAIKGAANPAKVAS